MKAVHTELRNTAGPLAAWILMLTFAAPALSADCSRSLESLVRLAADRIDVVFRDVAASTRALGEEAGRLLAHPAPVTGAEKASWQDRATTSGKTTGFRSWPEGSPTPTFQASFPSFYSYGGQALGDETVARLQAFEQLTPLLRAAYRSFDFSWVYLTTADDMMSIYPYVPIGQAVHNETPTAQAFYKAADLEHRSVGWTLPYLDLVGAGMMITASYPIFDGDRLLGVASRDITLKRLSRSVLKDLVRGEHAIAYLIDGRGLVIEASDPELATELETVNAAKKSAVLRYRTAAGLATQSDPKATASRFDWVNAVTEDVLAAVAQPRAPGTIALDTDGRRVLAARVDSTGWLLVLIVGKA